MNISDKINISISKVKKFVASKVIIDTKQALKHEWTIEHRDGCQLYCVINDKWVPLENRQDTLEKHIELSYKGKKLPTYVDIVWLAANIDIMVPIGFEFGNKVYNAEVHIKIKNRDKFLANYINIQMEQEMRDGLTYQYLSEYFILPDSDEKQHGVSIALRDKFLPKISELDESIKLTPDKLKEVLAKADDSVTIDSVELNGKQKEVKGGNN